MQSPEPAAAVETEGARADARQPGRRLHLVKPRAPRDLTALEREFLPPLLEIQETPPSPVHRAVLWSILGLVAALLIWAIVGRVSIVATAPGRLIPDGRVKEVQPLESAIVKAIHVREGQRVHQGDLLVELDPTLNKAELTANTDKYGFNQLEQARLAGELDHRAPDYRKANQPPARLKLEEQMRRARESAHAMKVAGAQAAVEEKRSGLAAARATLTKYEETTAIAAERESSARPLVDTGAISRIDYLQLKEELAQNRNDLAAQVRSVEQAGAAVAEAERNADQVERDRVADIYNDLDQRVASEPGLRGDLDKAKELYSLKWLRSPVEGTVQKVDVTTVGQVVNPAQSLVTIVPDGTALIVEASLSNEDIGYVKLGQTVEVKVDTFPFQKYGSLRGTLIWVSADAEDKAAASRDLEARSGASTGGQKPDSDNSGAAGYVYKVHIRTDRSQFTVAGEPRPLQAGMTVQADIVTDRRRVIDFFLSPVIKYLDEGLKVR
ncbi:MAG TPA: HlyD family type I secretion periplasmic adaptor subunit [Steroidobacteraceae bacterium]|jgi:hemolysin D